MFDFPQPSEEYYSDSYASVIVVGILASGIPWDLPYRCPAIAWNPAHKPYTILLRITSDGQIIELSLAYFLQKFSCIHRDVFKRDPKHRFTVLKIIADDPILKIWREQNIHRYPDKSPTVIKDRAVKHSWCDIHRREPDISYRNYL